MLYNINYIINIIIRSLRTLFIERRVLSFFFFLVDSFGKRQLTCKIYKGFEKGHVSDFMCAFHTGYKLHISCINSMRMFGNGCTARTYEFCTNER